MLKYADSNGLIVFFRKSDTKLEVMEQKNCLGKPNLSSVSKANLVFAEQTKMSHTGRAPVYSGRHFAYTTTCSLYSQVICLSCYFFRTEGIFSLLGEGRERRGDSLKQGKKVVCLHPALPILWSSNPAIGRFETGNQGRGTLCFHTIAVLFRQT